MIGMGTTIFLVNPVNFGGGVTYLLDTYSAGVAYSLRQLKTGVTSVVRVRRSSDNAESDFTATEITDGTLTTWTGANDGFVTKLYNQGSLGSAVDNAQATAANQPRIVSSGVVDTKNGLPAMYFDGSNDILISSSNFDTYCNYPNSHFAIASNEASSDVGVAFSVRETSGDNEGWLWQFDRSSNTEFVIDAGASEAVFNYLSSDNTNSQRLQTFLIDSSGDGEAFLNAVSQETISGIAESTPTASPLYFGGMQIASLRFTGYIQEMIWYNTDESANRTAIESDIDTHYWGADLLLDTYTGAAAAYSLRKLSKFTTSVVRVRRSSDNAESDFTATEITDGTLTTWTGANDGFVTTWYDQSGNTRDITQSTAGSQPQLVSSGTVLTKGSLPAVKFDGTNDSISVSAFSAIQSAPLSMLSVASNEGNTADSNPIISNRLSAGNSEGISIYLDRRVNAVGALWDNGATNNVLNYLATENNADQRLQTLCVDSSINGEFWLNGITQESILSMGSFATTPTEPLYFGHQVAGGLYHNGYIQEVIIFGSDESANRTDIESDINTHYTIY